MLSRTVPPYKTALFMSAGAIYINNAKVVKSEVFVYNLGTMFYIDHVLFGEDGLPPRNHQGSSSSGPFHGEKLFG